MSKLLCTWRSLCIRRSKLCYRILLFLNHATRPHILITHINHISFFVYEIQKYWLLRLVVQYEDRLFCQKARPRISFKNCEKCGRNSQYAAAFYDMRSRFISLGRIFQHVNWQISWNVRSHIAMCGRTIQHAAATFKVQRHVFHKNALNCPNQPRYHSVLINLEEQF